LQIEHKPTYLTDLAFSSQISHFVLFLSRVFSFVMILCCDSLALVTVDIERCLFCSNRLDVFFY